MHLPVILSLSLSTLSSATDSPHSYYQLEESSPSAINGFLSRVVEKALTELQESYCIEIEEVE